MSPPAPPRPWSPAVGGAALAAAALPLLSRLALWAPLGDAARAVSEPDVLLSTAVWTALPFLVLLAAARAAPRLRRGADGAAAVGLALSAAAWAWAAWDGYRAQTTDAHVGANIGLGFVLLGAPLVVLGVMGGVAWAAGRPARRP